MYKLSQNIQFRPISQILLDISIFQDLEVCLKLYMDVSFDFQVFRSHLVLRSSRYSSFSEEYQICRRGPSATSSFKWQFSRPIYYVTSDLYIQEAYASDWEASTERPSVRYKSGGVIRVVLFFLNHGFIPLGFTGKVLMKQHPKRITSS